VVEKRYGTKMIQKMTCWVSIGYYPIIIWRTSQHSQ